MKIDKYHVHEVLDRTHMVNLHLVEALENHPVLSEYPQIREKYEKIVDDLVDLYNLTTKIEVTE